MQNLHTWFRWGYTRIRNWALKNWCLLKGFESKGFESKGHQRQKIPILNSNALRLWYECRVIETVFFYTKKIAAPAGKGKGWINPRFTTLWIYFSMASLGGRRTLVWRMQMENPTLGLSGTHLAVCGLIGIASWNIKKPVSMFTDSLGAQREIPAGPLIWGLCFLNQVNPKTTCSWDWVTKKVVQSTRGPTLFFHWHCECQWECVQAHSGWPTSHRSTINWKTL